MPNKRIHIAISCHDTAATVADYSARLNSLALPNGRCVNQDQKRINVDFSSWVVESLDREAARIGVTRPSRIKVWLVERLRAEAANKPLNDVVGGGAIWNNLEWDKAGKLIMSLVFRILISTTLNDGQARIGLRAVISRQE